MTLRCDDPAWVESFTTEWVQAWNTHDLDRLLSHFRDDVVFTSPVGDQVIPGSGGVFEGVGALRAYWQRGLELIPDLQFEIVDVYAGIRSVVIRYRNQRDVTVAEVLVFDEQRQVLQGHGSYPIATQNPAGVRERPAG